LSIPVTRQQALNSISPDNLSGPFTIRGSHPLLLRRFIPTIPNVTRTSLSKGTRYEAAKWAYRAPEATRRATATFASPPDVAISSRVSLHDEVFPRILSLAQRPRRHILLAKRPAGPIMGSMGQGGPDAGLVVLLVIAAVTAAAAAYTLLSVTGVL
jgi:hypothetical protein